jgi:hypothetical protein
MSSAVVYLASSPELAPADEEDEEDEVRLAK